MKKTKVCPTCGEEHNNKRSDYCNKVISKRCLACKTPFETKCNKRNKEYCKRECSFNHKRNKCLTCGDPAKEKYCGKEIVIVCKVCGKDHKTKCGKTISTYCSGVCAMKDEEIQEKVKNTQIEKYGAFGFNTEKQKKTNLKRYGYITPAKNEKVKAKARETQLKNHGGVLAFNTDKQKETMMSKYGSLGRLGDPEELKRQQETMMERYGVSTPTEHPEFLEKSMKTLMEKYGQIFNNSNISKINLRYAEMLEQKLDVKVEFEHQVKGSFFDLYLPEHNIAIEINPTITHNSTRAFACMRNKCGTFPCEKHKPLDKNYHFNRAKLARDNDIRLIQLYEWDSDEDIIDMIKGKVVPANRKYSERHLNLRKIEQFEANKFLKDYHIQSGAKKQINCYGLFKNEELLAVATFGKARLKSKYQWNFMRYAVKEGVIIHGGSGRLVKNFIEEVDPESIISYIDFNHTTAKYTFLNSIGFQEIAETGPRLVFHNDKTNKSIPMTSLLMIGADRLLGNNCGTPSKCGINNEQIMIKEGFVKVYTAGNRVFVWKEDKQ